MTQNDVLLAQAKLYVQNFHLQLEAKRWKRLFLLSQARELGLLKRLGVSREQIARLKEASKGRK